MNRKASGIIQILLFTSILTLAFNIQPAKASGTIYIRADGSVDPPTAPIQQDGSLYTLTDNVHASIVVQKNNVVVDGAGYTVEGTGSGKGIDLTERCNVTIRNMEIKAFFHGIYLWHSTNNSISGNNVTANTLSGIRLFRFSYRNTISRNTLANNSNGIGLVDSSSNSISGNSIKDNRLGIELYGFPGNFIYHNNFVNNTNKGYTYNSENVWDDGYPSGGNYWSNYAGADVRSGPYQNETGRDGIGDKPYVIDADNTDRYPLMSTWGPVHNINSTLNYWTIQEAIDAPETVDGHTILVEEGIYYEHVVVRKSLLLVGQNRNSTIIDGNSARNVVEIRSDNVSVINFTIRNAGKIWGPPPSHGYPDSCVFGNNVRNVRIENNTVNACAVCIWFSDSFNVSVNDNFVFEGVYAGVIGYTLFNSTICRNLVDECGLIGLHLDGSSTHCKVEDNTVMDNLEGIELERSAKNLVERNRLIGNNISIVLNQCGGLNIFRRNNMTSEWYNLIVWGQSLEAFIQDIDTSNIVNGKTVYYSTNSHNLVVDPFNYSGLGYLAVVNCTNILIRDIDLSLNRDGMLLAQSTNCTLANVTLSGNQGPLLHGGLTLFKSDNNLVVNSRIWNNSVGVCLYQSDGNVFYHNAFVDNNRQVISNFHSPYSQPAGLYSINKWDNDFEGNHWSNYDGTDTDPDGIGDSPHVIDGKNQDNYPLMGMFYGFNVTYPEETYHVNVISNSTVSNFRFEDLSILPTNQSVRKIRFNVTGDDGSLGFCRICIPTVLMNDTYKVFVNGAEAPHTLLPCSNSTHSYLYFTYNHSTLEIVIIPEFPSLIILPFFMIATLLAVIVYRRKYSM